MFLYFRNIKEFVKVAFLLLTLGVCVLAKAEGTKELEAPGMPADRICKILLSNFQNTKRIPFALVGCSAEYRLNFTINDPANEKIYIGFGDVTNFSEEIKFSDVKFQIKDPQGNVVGGYGLQQIPENGAGYIANYSQVQAGPNINNSNSAGYTPLVITPAKKGDYFIEFEIPQMNDDLGRTFAYFDITVAKGNIPIPGRLWSKAWQFSSGSIYTSESRSYVNLYNYSNDSIVTVVNCNGLAGGIWTFYSNEWGCKVSGSWSERRKSVRGNIDLTPQYKVFINNPDSVVFPTGIIGALRNFNVLPHECKTEIGFAADVSKSGNIEIILDIPPLNPGTVSSEDVQLGYNVMPGYNVLLPAWDGRDNNGVLQKNGTQVEARVRFLNGLTNIPLYDVEEHPAGFKVDLVRPYSPTGSQKLKLFWDDTELKETVNTINGCLYGSAFMEGCHFWLDGDESTRNSWWYYASTDSLIIPIVIKFIPDVVPITGAVNVCRGQKVTYSAYIPNATTHHWHVSGPGFEFDTIKSGTDSDLVFLFSETLQHGIYTITHSGINADCGEGEPAILKVNLYITPIPVTGPAEICEKEEAVFSVPQSYYNVSWSNESADFIGTVYQNSIRVKWEHPGPDTLWVHVNSADCGSQFSGIPVMVNMSAISNFINPSGDTTCPDIEIRFADNSILPAGNIIGRNWNLDDGNVIGGNQSNFIHYYAETGTYNVTLTTTTNKNCKSSCSHPVTILSAPQASFKLYRNCLNDTIQLYDNSVGSEIISWKWNFFNNPLVSINLDTRKPFVIYNKTGDFPVELQVQTSHRCADTLSQLIAIHSLPVADFSYSLPCATDKTEFLDMSQNSDTSFSDYIWTTISQTNETRKYSGNPVLLPFFEPADYRVFYKVVDFYGCNDTIEKIVHVYPKPKSDFSMDENVNNINGLIQFHNHSSGANSYVWDFGNSESSHELNPMIKYNTESDFRITLISQNEFLCTDSSFARYYYLPGLMLPSAFTPDRNGLNDVFRPVTQRTKFSTYSFSVYNKYGQEIFHSSNSDYGWDGTYKGQDCPCDEYIWVITYNVSAVETIKTVTQRGLVLLLR